MCRAFLSAAKPSLTNVTGNKMTISSNKMTMKSNTLCLVAPQSMLFLSLNS